MRAIHYVILGVFTAALQRKSDVGNPTGGQMQDFKKAILAVRYLTDFGLLAHYRSHTDSTINYMSNYLRQFHEYKDIFLRYRVKKRTRDRADEVSKELTAEFASHKTSDTPLTAAQRACIAEDEKEECSYCIHETLEKDFDFKFPKMHMLLHYTEQIKYYGSLPQYSMEICETLHKTFKDAYCRSNHIDSIPQIIQEYTREHNFAVHEMDLEALPKVDPDIIRAISRIFH